MTSDDEIVARLQREGATRTPVELAELLGSLAGGLSQGKIVTFFKRAFPAIPLKALLDAGGWHRLSDGGLSDGEFNALLRPWIGA